MRKLACFGLALLAAVCFLGPVHAADDGKVLLRYQFTKGDQLHYDVDINMVMDYPSLGKQTVAAGSEMSMRVIADEGPAKNVELRIERMKMSTGSVNFDSGKKEDRDRMEQNPAMKPILLMIGTPIKIAMKETGEVTGYDLGEMKKKFEDANLAQGMASVKDQLDQLSNGSMILLPAHAVGKGEDWDGKVRSTAIGLGKIEVAYKFALDSIEEINGEKCARLGVTGTATMKAEDAAAKDKPKLTKYAETGTVIFAIGRGRMVSSEVDADIRFALPTGQEIAMKVDVKIHEAQKKGVP